MDFRKNQAGEKNVSSKGIQKKVKNTMSIASKRYNIDSYILLDLDKVLDDAYCSFRPVSADYNTRKELVKNLNAMAIDIFGKSEESSPVLEAYGSFAMNTFSSQKDLDVSINFSSGTSEFYREKKLEILTRFATKLRSLEGQGFVRNVVPILSARVPIVRFCDQGTGIECDLTVESKDGILTSQIIRIISQIDDRFQKLCLLHCQLFSTNVNIVICQIKHWAKAHGVNNASHNTLNSISITMLVAHHLQTQSPPILPPFSTLFKDGIDPSNVEKRTQKFLNWGQRNQESLVAICRIPLETRALCQCVEDFTDVSRNFARVVSDYGAAKIYSSINRTVDDILEFLNGKVAGEYLTQKLFSQQTVVEPITPVSPQQLHNKRVCLGKGYRAVGGISHGREETHETSRGKRKRSSGNWGCRFSGGEEPMPVGLWNDYSRSLDMPTPPPEYDRLLYKNFDVI
ncbi:putative polynucleotide adenylyltransferase [Arabidopsis thaliana]